MVSGESNLIKGYSDCTAIVAASAVLPVPGNPVDVRYCEWPNNAVAHREAKPKQVVFVSMFELALLTISHVAGSTREYHLINKADNRSLDTP